MSDAQPVVLDLFSKAGGASYGYHLAGYRVVGVDIEDQPNCLPAADVSRFWPRLGPREALRWSDFPKCGLRQLADVLEVARMRVRQSLP